MDAVEAEGLGALQEVHEVARAADARDNDVVLNRLLRADHPVFHGHFQGPAERRSPRNRGTI